MIDNNQYSEHLGLKKRCIRFHDEEKFDYNHEPNEVKLVLFDLLEAIMEFHTLMGSMRRMYKEKQD